MIDKVSKIKEIGEIFRLEGKFAGYETIKTGNINTTYCVTYIRDNGEEKKYIFQKVNQHVFKNPVIVMENIDKVTSYIRTNFPDKKTLHFHHIEDGHNYIFDEDRAFWRVMNYIDSIKDEDIGAGLDVIKATGKAFGEYEYMLSDFDGSLLYDTIPNFHNTALRLKQLFKDVELDEYDRVKECGSCLEYIKSVADKAGELSIRYSNGEFPVRVTHNDTKSNNVLFDRITKTPITVVDLDTVMPGMPMYDFGDAVRSVACSTGEDERDISKVYIDEEKFRAFCEGYISEVKDVLTWKEIDNLVLGTFSVTVELASRFLDDYITGDNYFKINYVRHNLVRTRCQLALAKNIELKYDRLQSIVKECAENK